MIHIFLATGFEEVEALTPLDILRRLNLEAQLVSCTGDAIVSSCHGVSVKTDALFEEATLQPTDALVLPGGMPGAENLLHHEALVKALVKHHKEGGLTCAICAAPMVLGENGILKGVKATCYPGFETHLHGADYTARLVQEDENIITGRGPGAAMEFGFTIAARYVPAEVVKQLRKGMIYEP